MYNKMKINLVLSLVASYLCVCVRGEQCTTPDGGPGECIKIFECESLMRKIRSPHRTPEDNTRMQQSQCGFDGRTPKVCCPDDLPRVDTRMTPVQEDFCFTPDGQEGRCVSQSNCQHIVSLLAQPNDEIRAFVRNSKCDGPDASSVCCGNQRPNLRPVRRCSSTVAPQYPGSRCCGVEASFCRIFGK